MYPRINSEVVGANLRRIMKNKGYSVREIQEYLHLACPQSIYRWFKGKALPSVDNLYALSKLFGISMEDLLVPRQPVILFEVESHIKWNAAKRIFYYYNIINNAS